MITKIFFLTVIVVYVIDLSGVIFSIEDFLSKWLKGRAKIPKPFSCSLCMVWWTGIIYLLVFNQFSLANLFVVALFSHFTGVIGNFLMSIRELFLNLIERIYNALK